MATGIKLGQYPAVEILDSGGACIYHLDLSEWKCIEKFHIWKADTYRIQLVDARAGEDTTLEFFTVIPGYESEIIYPFKVQGLSSSREASQLPS